MAVHPKMTIVCSMAKRETPTIHQSMFQVIIGDPIFRQPFFEDLPLVSLHSKIKGYCAQSRPRPVMGVMKTLNPWWGPSRLCKNIPSLFQNFGDWHLWGTMAKFNWSTAFNTYENCIQLPAPYFHPFPHFSQPPLTISWVQPQVYSCQPYAQCGGHGDRLNGIITVFLLAVSWQKRPWLSWFLQEGSPRIVYRCLYFFIDVYRYL